MPLQILSQLAADESPDVARAFADIAASLYASARREAGPVSTALAPAEIAQRFDEPMPEHGRPIAEVLERLERDVLSDANHLLHPMAMGHQVSAPLPAAVWSEVIASALNQSIAVSEMSPTLTEVERRVVRWMSDLAGFGERSAGTFTSGGTEATFTALAAARAALLPDAWESGMQGEPPALVCGEHAHYAITRAAGLLGIGARQAVRVPSDELHRMDTAALEHVLDDLARDNRKVMAVVASAGSTATGAFDDLETIGRTCEERGLWLHVDGAHGASALLSGKHRGRLRGLARARSLAWDPHKMLLMPLSAGVVLVREGQELAAAFSQAAPYLFHGDPNASPDLGRMSFLCSRRADVLKLWVALHRYGARGLAALYDQLCERAAELHALVESHPSFAPMHTPQSNIVCFRWLGSPAAGADTGAELEQGELDTLTDELRMRYNRSGEGWLTVTTLGGVRVLRVTVMNPRTTPEHLRELLDGLARTGAEVLAGRGTASAA
jgi:L-2,4-diaminobutyrate decarboxylase